MKIPGSMVFRRGIPAAFLRVSGPDAPVFLQGQFSQDLRRLEPGQGAYGLWLNHKGKVLGDSIIIKGGSAEFWVYSARTAATFIQKRLEDFIIADDVVVEDLTEGWRSVLLIGSAPADALSPPAFGFLVRARITLTDSWVWIFPQADAAAVAALLAGAQELTADAVERLRIDAGLAAVPSDIGPEDLPNEGGLEVEAVSYDKGCYLGQEVMARLKNRGKIRRHLRRVEGEGTLPPLPTGLFQDGKRAGELRSAVALASGGYLGLALMGANPVDATRPFGVSVEATGTVRLAPHDEK